MDAKTCVLSHESIFPASYEQVASDLCAVLLGAFSLSSEVDSVYFLQHTEKHTPGKIKNTLKLF